MRFAPNPAREQEHTRRVSARQAAKLLGAASLAATLTAGCAGGSGLLADAAAQERDSVNAQHGDPREERLAPVPSTALDAPRMTMAELYQQRWAQDKTALLFGNGQLPRARLCRVSVIDDWHLRCDAAAAFEQMRLEMQADGVEFVPLNSAYRSYYEQAAVRRQVGRRRALPAGASQHGYGVAIDVPAGEMQDWIRNHGEQYGWRAGLVRGEPWHFVFVTAEMVYDGGAR